MRPSVILILGVFLPSLILGGLALRTIGEQQVVLEKRTAEVFQADTEALAAAVRELVRGREEAFVQGVAALLANDSPAELAARFAAEGRALLPGIIPFAISPGGSVTARERSVAEDQLLGQNAAFLANAATVPVYQAFTSSPSGPEATPARAQTKAASKGAKEAAIPQRAVQPQQSVPPRQAPATSPPTGEPGPPELVDFRTATADAETGLLARFVNNDLQWVVWSRPAAARGYTFGGIIPAEVMRGWIAAAELPSGLRNSDGILAVLDERARPVSVGRPDFSADWKSPFVATPLGDLLPFWEAAAYPTDPSKLHAAAGAARFTVGSTIALALSAILLAGWFVWSDARRQMALATRKTDFVSNVSHELKTPLTSIRMFSELLASPVGDDPEKRAQYLRIITLESERLTRLINNVLDFARIEKNRRTYSRREFDLHAVIARTWEATRLHLESEGWSCTWTADDPPYPVHADADAVSQILVNLFSNAEKYAASGRSLELHTWVDGGHVNAAVLDRGPGVPRGQETRIFQAFYRAGDTLDNPVPGSGLGLALARRLAADLGGTLACSARRDGGACFTLTLPLA